MRRLATFLLSALLAAPLCAQLTVQTGQSKCWDEAGGVVPCFGTGQDGDTQSGTAWPNPRFTKNHDGTVTDNLTLLIWMQNADCFGAVPWQAALDAANGVSSGDCGLNDGSLPGDWRLPNLRELLSLVDYGKWDPALPAGHPFDSVASRSYWSSTSLVSHPFGAWSVAMRRGHDDLNYKTLGARVWAVR